MQEQGAFDAMCGIVGTATRESSSSRAWLAQGCQALAHRGPDDAGEWWSEDGAVGLAHRRLSIVDLSPLGHQPMHLPGTGLSVVFNGEIYNFRELRAELESMGHQFCSQSDTEVLLVAYRVWGTDCLLRMNGMFAFGIYDAPRAQVFLARDRAGEKPLFYRLDEGSLFFASELKALLAHPHLPRRVDSEALDCYLAMGYVPGDRCILQGFRKLPPAHAMVFNLAEGQARVWRYWQLPEYQPSATEAIDEQGLVEECESLLESAVGRQLVADVPVGVLLSGGVDSSLVTAMAVRHSRHVRTFSIGFPGTSTFDETPHARLVARHFGTEHTELIAEPSAGDLLPRLAKQFDEPLVDSSMIPTWLVSHLVRQHCTVALGGDGGDELFGGYGHYDRLLGLEAGSRHFPIPIRRLLSKTADFLPVGFKGRNWLQALGTDWSGGLPMVANYFDPATRRHLLGNHAMAAPAAERIFAERTPRAADLLQRATRMDFSNYMAEDILVKVDRASMMNSLEIRAPFLDYKLVEFAFGRVPTSLKTSSFERKILLKRLCQRILPPEFDRQRKQGFGIPMNDWLKAGPLRELYWSVLLDPQCGFDRTTVTDLLKGQDAGRGNGERLFALVVFELWRREYSVEM